MTAFQTIKPYLFKYKWRFLFGVSFVLVTNYLSARIPVIAGNAINQITNRDSLMDELRTIGIFLVAVAGLAGAFRYLMRRVMIDTSRDVEFDFRNDIYAHLQRLDPTFYDNHSTGDIMSRMTNDIDSVRMMIGPAIMYTANTLFSVPIVLVSMLLQDSTVTLWGLIPLLGMPLIVRKLGKHLHIRFRRQQDQLADVTTFVQEAIAGIRVIKAYGQEDSNYDRFDEENQEYIDRSLEVAKLQSFFFPTIRLLGGTGMLLILVMGARDIIAGNMEYGTLLSLLLLYWMLIWPLIAAGWVLNIYQRGASALDRINGILQADPKVRSEPTAVEPASLPKDLDVEFRELTFQYEGTTQPALQDITLNVPAGKTIGIVGRVGSGKSTLVHLLLRLYAVERGKLLLGGIDINDWPLDELRRRVGIVFQETFLFSDSIAENIRFGALGELSDEDVEAAATKADVHKDIVEFPDRYATLLGERGINLSGGQKQRLSMARALVRDASIMILDDSLSAVDTHTEEEILSELREIMKGRSTFLISHRISTVSMADEIIVLEDGRVTQRGTHEQLIAKPGLYAELHRRQLLEEEVEAIG
ncbi:ABC transporter ATP-binding protein/permease [bacterium]|nr:ABC transporter ATP-binding protein/permease [bacterium]